MLAASAIADAKAASAAQKASEASQAMQATQAAVNKTHADLTDLQERHSKALDKLNIKLMRDALQYF